MNQKELYDWLANFDASAPPVISTDTAFSILSASHRYGTALDSSVEQFLSTTVGKLAKPGWTKSIEKRPDGWRVVNKRSGKLLPAESGDDTP